MIDSHDKILQRLLQAVRKYDDELVNHPKLKEMVDKLWPHKMEDPPELDLADHYAAEYIINDIATLPAYYQMSATWNQHSGEFLRLRDVPELRDAWQEVERARKNYSEPLEKLIAELTTIRDRLSVRLDVPIVERVAS